MLLLYSSLRLLKMQNQVYYKIIKSSRFHNDYTYVPGLNILNKPFVEVGCCVKGGLYFTTAEYLHCFADMGDDIFRIELPFNNPDFKMAIDPEKNKWRANMIILKNHYSLYDPQTFKTLSINCTDFYILDILSKKNNVDCLKLWFEKYKLGETCISYSEKSLDIASEKAYIEIIKTWFWAAKTLCVCLRYSEKAFDNACVNNHNNVVTEWILAAKTQKVKLRWTKNILITIIEKNNIDVLNTLSNNIQVGNIKKMFTKNVFENAENIDTTPVVKLWINNVLKQNLCTQ